MNIKVIRKKKVTPITITVTGNASAVMVNKALAIGDSVSLARDVSNHPANIATPTFLAKHAKRIGKAKNFKVKILDYKDCKSWYGCFLWCSSRSQRAS